MVFVIDTDKELICTHCGKPIKAEELCGCPKSAEDYPHHKGHNCKNGSVGHMQSRQNPDTSKLTHSKAGKNSAGNRDIGNRKPIQPQ